MSSVAKVCSVEGCGKKHLAQGFCKTHYLQAYRRGTLSITKRPARGVCAIEGCEGKVVGRTWCNKHWKRWRAHGDPNITKRRVRGKCIVEGCENLRQRHKMCHKHFNRYKRYGDPLIVKVLQEHHGLRRHPLYEVWKSMKQRCSNLKAGAYKWYGARGIRVCERWDKSFQAFWDDIGSNRPSAKHSIDRKDNNGHYSCGKCPECLANGWTMNCKWSTQLEQSRNTGMFRNNTSGFKGVTSRKGKWEARITVKYRRITLGLFATKQEAAAAYEAAKLRYHGDQPDKRQAA